MSAANKRKRKSRSRSEKLEVLKQFDKGASVSAINRQLDIPKSSLYDIKKNREVVEEELESGSTRPSGEDQVNKVVYEWFMQQTSKQRPVLGIELTAFASQQNCDGKSNTNVQIWLKKFCNKYDIKLTKTPSFARKPDVVSRDIETFRNKLQRTMSRLSVSENCVYVAKGFALLWKSLPSVICGFKLSKVLETNEHHTFGTLLCANAEGTHKLKSLVVGRSKLSYKGRKYITDEQPQIIYHENKIGWVTEDEFYDWFKTAFINEVKDFQVRELKVEPEEIRFVVILEDCPSTPSKETLLSLFDNGQVAYLKYPSSASAKLSLNQGIFELCKRAYRLQLLDKMFLNLERVEGKEFRSGKNNEDAPSLQSEDTKSSQYEGTPPLQLEDAPPLQSEDASPLQYEDTKPSQYEDTPPLQSEDTPPLQYEGTKSSQYEDTPLLQPEDTPPLQPEDASPLQPEDTPRLQYEERKPWKSQVEEELKKFFLGKRDYKCYTERMEKSS